MTDTLIQFTLECHICGYSKTTFSCHDPGNPPKAYHCGHEMRVRSPLKFRNTSGRRTHDQSR